MYRVITIGVNGTGARALKFAEKDAFDFYRAFDGALGPPGVVASCLRGPEATRQEVISLLMECIDDPPDVLCIPFSCHGNADGLALYDGLLSFEVLARMLRAVGARVTVLIIDACGAGGFMRYANEGRVGVGGFLEQSWAEALADAVPGLRIYLAASADANSREGADVSNGHFSRAVLDAMFCSNGELHAYPFRFVSDAEMFRAARTRMRRQWPNDAAPMAFGIKEGSFPLLLSQADEAVGEASIRRFDLGARPVTSVAVQMRGRRHVPTFVRCRLVDTFDIKLACDSVRVEPGWDSTNCQHDFEFDGSVFSKNPLVQLDYDAGYSVAVDWIVEVVDQRGRVLAHEWRRRNWRRAA